MRIAGLFVLAFWLAGSPAVTAQADPAEEFNEAYRTYTALKEQARWTDAIPHAQKALGLAETLLADDPGQIAMMTYLTGEAMLRGHSVEDGTKVLELAIERYRSAYGESNIRVSEPIFLLADALHLRGSKENVNRARRGLEEALELYRNHFGKKDPRLSEPLRRLASNALRAGDGRAAEGFSSRAVRLTKDAGEAYVAEHIANLFQHGRVAYSRRSDEKAISRLLQARSLMFEEGLQDSSFRLQIEALLIDAYERDGQSDEATAYVQSLARIDPDQDTREPVPLFRIAPEYPFGARERCREGSVIVEFAIDREGRVKDPRVIEANPEKIFEKVALKAVSRFRYKPRIVDGEFVEAPNRTIRLVWRMEKSQGSKFRC